MNSTEKPDYYLIMTDEKKIDLPDHLKDVPRPDGFPQGLSVYDGDRCVGWIPPDSVLTWPPEGLLKEIPEFDFKMPYRASYGWMEKHFD